MGVFRRIVYSAVTVAIIFATIELLLRLTGFQHGNQLEQMRLSFPVDEYNAQSDQPLPKYGRELFWRPIWNTFGHH